MSAAQLRHVRLLLFPMVLLVVACAPGSQPASPPGSGAAAPTESRSQRPLNAVIRTEPFDILDVASGRNRITVALFTADLAGLQQGIPTPVLAEAAPELGTDSWKVNADGSMETTYRLKPNLTWHDGKALSPEDFTFAHRATAQRLEWGLSTSSINLLEHRTITSVTAADDRTIVIRWRGPYPQAATPSLTAMPPHILTSVVDQGAEALGSHPYWTTQYVGLGPYRLTKWEPGAYLEGTAFDGYVLGKPKLETVRVTWAADENSTLSRLLAGDADIALDDAIGMAQGNVLKGQWATDNVGKLILSPAWMRHIQVQFRPHIVNPAAVTDLRVRKAIAHAIDRQGLVDALVDGLGIPTDNIGVPNTSYYSRIQQATSKYPYDTRIAEQFLQEAGLGRGSDGFWTGPGGRFAPSVLGIAEGQEGQETTVVVDMLRRIGIDAQLNLVPGAMIQRDDEMKSVFPALRTNYINGEDQIVARLLAAEISAPDNRWGAKNKAGYANEHHDRLYQEWRRTLDANARTDLMVQLVKFYSDELPVIPMYVDVAVIPHRSSLEGPTPQSTDTAYYHNLHLWSWKS
jgi:peptide/nickel transport system substrate-binding protein